jgi:hypothetical protein
VGASRGWRGAAVGGGGGGGGGGGAGGGGGGGGGGRVPRGCVAKSADLGLDFPYGGGGTNADFQQMHFCIDPK